MIDDGEAIHYAAVERGTPVYSSDGVEVGEVEQQRLNALKRFRLAANHDRKLTLLDGDDAA